MIDKLGGRKTALVLLLAATGVSLHVSVGLEAHVTSLLTWLMGLFVAGNVCEHGFGAWRKASRPSSAGSAAVELVGDEVGKQLVLAQERIKADMLEVRNALLKGLREAAAAAQVGNGELNVPDELKHAIQAHSNNAKLTSDALKMLIRKTDHMTQSAGFKVIN